MKEKTGGSSNDTKGDNYLTSIQRHHRLYYLAAAGTTGLAGIIHLALVVNAVSHNIYTNTITLFLIGGIAQVFWIIPVLKRWGRAWYSIGIAGTIVFIVLWAITRMQGNPITHRASRVGPIDIAIEVVQFGFIGLGFAILVIENRRMRKEEAW
jgi:VIT1/CCC1 family predicted Fe2+/Mn2+ transporter